jgi:RNA polymerase sigma-70 factor (family 1)
MTHPLTENERILIEKIRNNDQSALATIFKQYYRDLVTFAWSFCRDSQLSEEIVQDVFLRIWENRVSLDCHSSLKSYLLKAVQNRSINWIRHQEVKNRYTDIILTSPVLAENDTDNYILHSELEQRLKTALDKLPVEVAETFRLSRLDQFSYREISEKLLVSVRTVEVRISKALLLIKSELGDLLLFCLLLFPLLL